MVDDESERGPESRDGGGRLVLFSLQAWLSLYKRDRSRAVRRSSSSAAAAQQQWMRQIRRIEGKKAGYFCISGTTPVSSEGCSLFGGSAETANKWQEMPLLLLLLLSTATLEVTSVDYWQHPSLSLSLSLVYGLHILRSDVSVLNW